MSNAHMRDYYAVLGLPTDAEMTAVKSAYRELLKSCHPDLRPDDAEAAQRFRDITDAYEAIRSPRPRRDQHRIGAAPPRRPTGFRAVLLPGAFVAAAACLVTLAMLALNETPPAPARLVLTAAAPVATTSATASTDVAPTVVTAISGGDLVRSPWPVVRSLSKTTASTTPDTETVAEPLVRTSAAGPATPLVVAAQAPAIVPQHPATTDDPVAERRLAQAADIVADVAPSDTPRPEPAFVPDWRLFRDPASGLSFRHPAALSPLPSVSSLDGDRLFQSADGRTVVRSYASADVSRSSATQRRKRMDARYRGARLEFVSETSDRLLLGGTLGSEGFREISLLSCDGQVVQGLAIVYPLSEADRREAEFHVMAKSLVDHRPHAQRCRGLAAAAFPRGD